jgi:hypothetical protein
MAGISNAKPSGSGGALGFESQLWAAAKFVQASA